MILCSVACPRVGLFKSDATGATGWCQGSGAAHATPPIYEPRAFMSIARLWMAFHADGFAQLTGNEGKHPTIPQRMLDHT